MKPQIEIEAKLSELQQFCSDENFATEGMQGEILALKFAPDILGEDL